MAVVDDGGHTAVEGLHCCDALTYRDVVRCHERGDTVVCYGHVPIEVRVGRDAAQRALPCRYVGVDHARYDDGACYVDDNRVRTALVCKFDSHLGDAVAYDEGVALKFAELVVHGHNMAVAEQHVAAKVGADSCANESLRCVTAKEFSSNRSGRSISV